MKIEIEKRNEKFSARCTKEEKKALLAFKKKLDEERKEVKKNLYNSVE